jgi:hypothetical protein
MPGVAVAAPIVHRLDVTADGTIQTFEGLFGVDTDVAAIQFSLEEGVFDFTAETTSFATGGFDPALWLYFAPVTSDPANLSLYSLYLRPLEPVDPADPVFVPTQNDDNELTGALDSFLSLQLTQAGTYILALTQTGNNALEDAFGFDQSAFDCLKFNEDGSCKPFDGYSANFAGTITITNTNTAPVPEPGTLSLLALGSLATAAVRRRRNRPVMTSQ